MDRGERARRLRPRGHACLSVSRAHDYKFTAPLFTIGFHAGPDSRPDNSLSPKLRPLRAPDNAPIGVNCILKGSPKSCIWVSLGRQLPLFVLKLNYDSEKFRYKVDFFNFYLKKSLWEDEVVAASRRHPCSDSLVNPVTVASSKFVCFWPCLTDVQHSDFLYAKFAVELYFIGFILFHALYTVLIKQILYCVLIVKLRKGSCLYPVTNQWNYKSKFQYSLQNKFLTRWSAIFLQLTTNYL